MNVGCNVSEETVKNSLKCSPEYVKRTGCLQSEDPCDYRYDHKTKNYSPVYLTFVNNGSGYQFCGFCFKNSTTHVMSGMN